MNIKNFADELAAVEIPGVYERLTAIPRELDTRRLPSQFVDMPQVTITPGAVFGTMAEAGGQYAATLRIAQSRVTDGGVTDEQRTCVLELAAEVEAWAKTTPYTVQILTEPRITVGSFEYRGVTARITADEDID